jgi:hypothetical protein
VLVVALFDKTRLYGGKKSIKQCGDELPISKGLEISKILEISDFRACENFILQ